MGVAAGHQVLSTLDRLAPLRPDTTPPSVVHVQPPDGAHDVPVDAVLAIRFSEPVRVSTVTAATMMLSGPTGPVEGAVATAESGLLAFFSPSLLEADTPYTLALAGITDTSGHPLPAFSSRFRTGRSAGEGPRIASFTPTAGSPGDEVTLRGERFTGATGVAFGGIAAASFTFVNDTTLKAVVPANAVTGPLSVTTPAGTGSSQGHFVVLSRPDFKLAAAPDRGETVPGDTYVFALHVVPSGGFLGFVKLAVSGLPPQLAGTLSSPQLGPAGYAYLTIAADARAHPGQYRFTITGTSTLGGTEVRRTVAATLRVGAPAGTSLSGQLVRLDGTPIPGYRVRIGRQATTTDAGGNFLLKHLKVSTDYEDLALVLDGRPARAPAGLLYPVFEKLVEYGTLHAGRPNKFPHGSGRTSIPTLDPRNAARVERSSSREQVLRFPHLPGLEIAVPPGTTLTDIDGRPTATLNVAETPLHLAAAHLQHLPPGVGASALLSLQYGGTTASKPLRVTVPNRGNLPPGARVPLNFYDVTKDGWFSPGQGTVSDDGTRIVPDPDAGITRLGCLAPPPVVDGKVVCIEDCGTGAGGLVDPTSGVVSTQTPDYYLMSRFPFRFARTYRSASARPGPFGIGTGHNFEMVMANVGGVRTLVLPSNYRVPFVPAGPNLYTPTAGLPVFAGAILVCCDYGFAHTLSFKDGTRWHFLIGGYLGAIDDRNGNRLTLTRDAQFRLTRITEPGGRFVSVDYDPQGRIVRLTGLQEQAVAYTYSPAGDLETVTDPMGGVTRYTYDANHNLLTLQSPQGAVRGVVDFTTTYDPVTQRVTQQTLANGGTWQYSYQAAGDVVTQTTVTDPRGFQTVYGVANGYLVSVTNVTLGQTTTFTRDPTTQHITRIVDPLNRTTDLHYDANKNVDRITRYKDPPANTQPVIHQFTYDTARFNLLTSYTDPLNHTWTYGLDAAGKNVVTITNPLLKTWTITRLPTGEPQWIEDPLLHRTTFGYDVYGHVTSVTDHLGNTTSYTYDLLGHRLTTTDPRGFTTRSRYDPLGRLTSTANPLGQAVRFEYDANSNLTKVIDPRNGQIVYTYNAMDWLETRTDPLGRGETYTYDLAGNVTQAQDRKNQVTNWAAYDALNRPTTVTYHDASTMTYTFDAGGRLWQLTDSLAGTITRTFDALDRLTVETTPQGTITYGPDDADRRGTMTVAGQPPVAYAWDNANRLQTIIRDTLTATYGYDDANRRTSLTLPNQVTIAYGYDEANRLTALTYSGLQTGPQSLTYTYDPAGNRTRVGGSWARALLPAVVTGGTYDAANRQTVLGGKSMTYDFNGNLATLTESSQTTTYTWDVRDRLGGIAGPGLTAAFAYDAEDRRTSKTVTGFTTTFQYDGRDITRETSGGSSIDYFRGRRIDEPLSRLDSSGNTSCYPQDALASTVAVTDTAGNPTTTYSYEPFGGTVVTGPGNQPFQFTGRENDSTGLYYYRARYYDPTSQRFLKEDPIRLAGGGSNFYAYVMNNPTRFRDPHGFSAQSPDPIGKCLNDANAEHEACEEDASRDYRACRLSCQDLKNPAQAARCITRNCGDDVISWIYNCGIMYIERARECLGMRGSISPCVSPASVVTDSDVFPRGQGGRL